MPSLPISELPFAGPLDGDDVFPVVQDDTTKQIGFVAAVNAILNTHELNVLDYGVTGDGVTNDLPAIQTLVDAYGATRTLRFPRARYRLGVAGVVGPNRITLVSGTRIVCDPGAVFEVNQVDSGASLIYASGTDGTKSNMTGDTTAGTQTLTLPSGQGAAFAWGDLVGIEAQTAIGLTTNGVDSFYAREVRKVIKVTGDVLTLDAPLEYSYATSATAQFWKITPIRDLYLAGMRFESGPDVIPGETGCYTFNLRKTVDCRIVDLEFHHLTGGVRLFDAYDTTVDGINGDSLPAYGDALIYSPLAAYGYVLQAAGATTNLVVDRIRGRDCRHVFTTISDERAGTPTTWWGGPMFVQINNGIGFGSPDSKSIWDTHEYGRHIHFNNCQAIGGGAAVCGFQMRAQDIQLNNCRAIRCGLQGVIARKDSRNVQVIGGEYAYNGGNGVALHGADGHVVGARIHHNVSSGVTVAATTAVDNRVADCKIYDNLYGILDGALSTRTTISGCEIPQSATQSVAVVQPSATSVIFGNTHLGYGTNLSGISTPTTGCRVVQVVTDSAVVNNQAVNVGNVGGSINYTETLYRGGASQVRTDAVMRAASFNVAGGPTITSGTGTPEGAVSAPVGSIRFRTDGGAGTSIYVKESGAGNTGWVAK